MAPLRRSPALPSEVVSDQTVMSGEPVVRGTRILAETIASYLRAGKSREEMAIPHWRLTVFLTRGRLNRTIQEQPSNPCF